MKKVGIITLTRRKTLAYSVLKKIVDDLGYTAICGDAVGSDGIFFPIEELSVVGHDFLTGFFKKVAFTDLDAVLISAPYTVNLFHLPKLIWCLRQLNTAPIILGGNEMSNNYSNIMRHRYTVFMNDVVDIAPDFIVRGAAENVLFSLLPLLDKTSLATNWNREFVDKLLDIPNLVFWRPQRDALFSTVFSSKPLKEKYVFTYVKYGEKSMAITLQRACVWTKKSKGGCLFCAIASQFGKDFHSAVSNDAFVEELADILKNDTDIHYIDVWDDTFNIDESWVLKICDALQHLSRAVGRSLTFSCFLRPKGLSDTIARKMEETHFKVAFIGADALTEDLSRRMRRGCTIPELNASIAALGRYRILPRLSVQLFTPESTIDDLGITATVILGSIKNGESTAHVHLYTFPLFGSDMYKLLNARGNLKKVPSPLLHRNQDNGFESYRIAYDFTSYDPDVEEIKRKTFHLLDLSAAFYVKTYPGDHVDGERLKTVIGEVRTWSAQAKKTHPVKSLWYMIVLLLEDQGNGLGKQDWMDYLARNDSNDTMPELLKTRYDDFGYRYTLSRTRDEVMDILTTHEWVHQTAKQAYRLTPNGLKKLRSMLEKINDGFLSIAAYGVVDKNDLLNILHLQENVTGGTTLLK